MILRASIIKILNPENMINQFNPENTKKKPISIDSIKQIYKEIQDSLNNSKLLNLNK